MKNETEDYQGMIWVLLRNLEERTNPDVDILDKVLVEQIYDRLNEDGYTKYRPKWEYQSETK